MWPDNVSEWLSLFAVFIGLVLTIGGLLGKWLSGKLNGLGVRLDDKIDNHIKDFIVQREATSALKASLEMQAYEIQGIQHHRHSHEKELSEIREIIRGLTKIIDIQRENHSRELKEISEAVTEIKTTVKFLRELKGGN